MLLKRLRRSLLGIGRSPPREFLGSSLNLRPLAAYAQLGQIEDARAEAAEVLRINPGFTL
jgi:hypothetical protein